MFGCSPCHTGHTEVSYYEAYDEWEENCWEAGETQVCIPYLDHHPARCSDSFVCDLRCEVLDNGKAEAHAKHQVLNLYGDKVDPRCNWVQGKAWPK